jgi:hypothetical protein
MFGLETCVRRPRRSYAYKVVLPGDQLHSRADLRHRNHSVSYYRWHPSWWRSCLTVCKSARLAKESTLARLLHL